MIRSPRKALAEDGAAVIAAAFDAYVENFRDLTRHARTHFEARDWTAASRDSARRFDLYTEVVNGGLARLTPLLGERITDRPTWTGLRAAYAVTIDGRGDAELAESFFNSFTRRIFHTIGVDPAVEFIDTGKASRPLPEPGPDVTRYVRLGSLETLVRGVLEATAFAPGWDDLDADAGRVAATMEDALRDREIRGIELATPVFFRGRGAYLVGKVLTDRGDVPWLLSMTNPNGRIVVDALLTTEDEVSIVFSFARSYFFVDTDRPARRSPS